MTSVEDPSVIKDIKNEDINIANMESDESKIVGDNENIETEAGLKQIGDDNIEIDADDFKIIGGDDNIPTDADGFKIIGGDDNISTDADGFKIIGGDDNIPTDADGFKIIGGDDNLEEWVFVGAKDNKSETNEDDDKKDACYPQSCDVDGSVTLNFDIHIGKEKDTLCTQEVIEGKGSRISQLIKGFDQSINCSYCQQILTGDYVVLIGVDDIKLHSECREKYLDMTRPLCLVCNKPIMEDRWKTYNNENYHTACRPN